MECHGGTGSRTPSISANGRYVAFESACDDLTTDTNIYSDVFLRDRVTHQTTMVSVTSAPGNAQGNLPSSDAMISDDGLVIAFLSSSPLGRPDANGADGDLYVRDLTDGTTTIASVDSSGTQVIGNADAFDPAISGDGRYVAFDMLANLGVGDTNNLTDVFV